MDLVYVPPPSYPSRFGGSTVRRTQSTHDEVSRILDWNLDVASAAPSPRGARPGLGADRDALTLVRRPAPAPVRSPGAEEHLPFLRRSVTTTTMTSSIFQPGPSPREGSRGLSAAGVAGIIGAAAGVAAGAAITYSIVKHGQSRDPVQDLGAPVFQRRSTFPDPCPDRRHRFVEVERTVEKIRYPEDHPALPVRHAPPTHLARYHLANSARGSEVDDMYGDSRSRHSSRLRSTGPGAGAGSRSRSEAPSPRRPLLLTGGEHHSSVATPRHSAVSPPRSIRRSATYDTGEHETYVSAKSRRSSITIQPPSAQIATHRSQVPSWATATASRAPRRDTRDLGRAVSYLPPVLAHKVPLPASGVGSSRTAWDEDSDSVAPSDSISCVGSRRSGRSYR